MATINIGTTAKEANAHESIHLLMEDIGDFVAFKQLVTCLYNIHVGQHDSLDQILHRSR